MTARWALVLVKRTATGLPVPSPQVNVRPLAQVTLSWPRRTSEQMTFFNNQSTGDLHMVNPADSLAPVSEGAPSTPELIRSPYLITPNSWRRCNVVVWRGCPCGNAWIE
jgi:hypothetical protein